MLVPMNPLLLYPGKAVTFREPLSPTWSGNVYRILGRERLLRWKPSLVGLGPELPHILRKGQFKGTDLVGKTVQLRESGWWAGMPLGAASGSLLFG